MQNNPDRANRCRLRSVSASEGYHIYMRDTYIWGRNPILETLHSQRRMKRILLAEGQREASTLVNILDAAQKQHIPVEIVPRTQLDQLSRGAVHQGCLAIVEA